MTQAPANKPLPSVETMALTLELLASLSPEEFASLSKETLGSLTPEQVRVLSEAQLEKLDDTVLADVWTANKLKALFTQ
jgi:hypothetical protein